MKKINMERIAELAGVSTATVSRTINSPHLVKLETRAHILQIMEQNDYVYDALAADFSRKTTRVLGLIVPTIDSSIFSRFALGIQEAAAGQGYSVVISHTNYHQETESKLIDLFFQRRMAGIILVGLITNPKQLIDKSKKMRIPIVITWQIQPDLDMNVVGFDNYKAARSVTQYLISLHHRRIGLIIKDFAHIPRVKNRFDAYRSTLMEHDLEFDPSLVAERNISLVDGKEAMLHLLSGPNPPTAVFAASDVFAMGALAAAREMGLSVPGDVSVVGFDDIEFSSYTVPSLTTVRVPAYEMGKKGAEVLIKNIQNPNLRSIKYTLDTDLIIRESCWKAGERPPGNSGA